MDTPPKINYIYIITNFQKSITYQHSFKTEPKIKLKELEDHIDELLIDKKEMEEAELVGEELVKELKEAEESLNSAKNWVIYDMVGEDFFLQ